MTKKELLLQLEHIPDDASVLIALPEFDQDVSSVIGYRFFHAEIISTRYSTINAVAIQPNINNLLDNKTVDV